MERIFGAECPAQIFPRSTVQDFSTSAGETMRLTDDWYVSSTLLWTRRMLTACVTIIVPTFAGNLQL